MSAIVALRLLLEGQREVTTGVAGVTRETSALGVAAKKTTVGLKGLSGGLSDIAKQGVTAASATEKSSAKIVAAEKKVADALKASALAAKQAADAKVRAANLAADAVARQAAGDLKAAEASKIAARAATEQAASYTKMAAAMRSQASAARASLVSVRASERRAAGGGGGAGLFGAAARTGGMFAKAGAATGAFLGYEGIRRASGIQSQSLALHTLANVPMSQIGGLQQWAISNSVGLRATPAQLLQEMYRIASASPGHPYTAGTLSKLTAAAQRFTLVGGPTVNPDQAARIFGITRANGYRLNPDRLGALARATIGSGDMTAGDLVSAIGTGGLLPNAARHKMSLQSIFGVLAELGDLGINGSRAGNAMQRAISLISSPNGKQAAGLYQSIGLSPTALDQVIRSKGILPAMGLLQRQLAAHASTAMPGMTGSVGDFRALGYSRKQAASMAGQGSASLQDLLLTRMFGGAKQAVPIIALLNGLNRTGSKTAEIGKGANLSNYLADFKATQNTPANTFKRFDLDLQKLETNIGLKLIPKLMSMANWLSRNQSMIKDIGTTVEVLAIPAMGAWFANLAGKGVSSLSSFSSGLRGASGGIGTMQKAVLGVTAAIGVWEFGSHTSNSGAGMAEAGLGGALAGLTAGFLAGGPWGAAIGAASGGLLGLAAHFRGVENATNASERALENWMTTAYQADHFKIGAQFRGQLVQYLSGLPGSTVNALSDAGVKVPQILRGLKAGVPGAGPAYNQLTRAYQSGRIGVSEYNLGASALSALDTAFLNKVQVWNSLASLEGKTTQAEKVAAGNLQTLLQQTAASASGVTSNGSLSQLLGGALTVHNHVHLDGKEITHSVKHHLSNEAANLGLPAMP